MSLQKFFLSTALAITAGVFGANPAEAATSMVRCDEMLTSLSPMQSSLDQMQGAADDNRVRQQLLHLEASRLATDIANRLGAGASELDVQPLVNERNDVLVELEQLVATLALLEREVEALSVQVETAERGYIACVEATID
ncbi:MAG: hypothetical protein AAF799_48590 [Myxococcota bacterium]